MHAFALGVALTLVITPASAWFWETPTWQSINADLADDYPRVKHMSTQALERLLANRTGSAPLLIDARAFDEFSVSHIEGAVHAETVEQVKALLAQRPPDSQVIVYCSVGVRSARLVAKLQDAGITNSVNLKGSIFEWVNRGLPVYKDGQTTVGVHPFNRKWGALLDQQHWSHDPD